MIQKKHLLLLILCFWNALGFSQNTIPTEKLELNSWEIDNYFGFDNQKNQYGIKNNVVIKRSTTDFEYKNIGLGKITRIDFQNPLQIVVFYKDFNTVVLLDNQLNEIKRIDFNLKPELVQLEAVGLSAQNQLWIYDGITNKIGLYNITNDHLKWISTPLKSGLKNYCWKLWHANVITWDGLVVPCCFDKDAMHQLGNLKRQSFRETWKNSNYHQFRTELLNSRKNIFVSN